MQNSNSFNSSVNLLNQNEQSQNNTNQKNDKTMKLSDIQSSQITSNGLQEIEELNFDTKKQKLIKFQNQQQKLQLERQLIYQSSNSSLDQSNLKEVMPSQLIQQQIIKNQTIDDQQDEQQYKFASPDFSYFFAFIVKKFEKFEENQQRLESKVDNLDSKVNNVDSKVNNLDCKMCKEFEIVNFRFDQIEETLIDHENLFEGIITKMETLKIYIISQQ